MAMWIGLHFELEKAYETEPPEEATIRQLYDYAFWCWKNSQNGDMTTALACAFFEHLPIHDKVSRDLPNRMSRADFLNLEPIFRYFLNDKEFKAFVSRFLADKENQR